MSWHTSDTDMEVTPLKAQHVVTTTEDWDVDVDPDEFGMDLEAAKRDIKRLEEKLDRLIELLEDDDD